MLEVGESSRTEVSSENQHYTTKFFLLSQTSNYMCNIDKGRETALGTQNQILSPACLGLRKEKQIVKLCFTNKRVHSKLKYKKTPEISDK